MDCAQALYACSILESWFSFATFELQDGYLSKELSRARSIVKILYELFVSCNMFINMREILIELIAFSFFSSQKIFRLVLYTSTSDVNGLEKSLT